MAHSSCPQKCGPMGLSNMGILSDHAVGFWSSSSAVIKWCNPSPSLWHGCHRLVHHSPALWQGSLLRRSFLSISQGYPPPLIAPLDKGIWGHGQRGMCMGIFPVSAVGAGGPALWGKWGGGGGRRPGRCGAIRKGPTPVLLGEEGGGHDAWLDCCLQLGAPIGLSPPPVPSFSLPGLSSPPYSPFLSLGQLCQRSPRTVPVSLLRVGSTRGAGGDGSIEAGGHNGVQGHVFLMTCWCWSGSVLRECVRGVCGGGEAWTWTGEVEARTGAGARDALERGGAPRPGCPAYAQPLSP